MQWTNAKNSTPKIIHVLFYTFEKMMHTIRIIKNVKNTVVEFFVEF